VKESDIPSNSPLQPSIQEAKFLQQLRANPAMAERFGQIMERFEQEIASGGDANQAEMMVIEELRHLGQTMVVQWAGRVHQQAVAQAKEQNPALTNHAQKNCAGTVPSEPSP